MPQKRIIRWLIGNSWARRLAIRARNSCPFLWRFIVFLVMKIDPGALSSKLSDTAALKNPLNLNNMITDFNEFLHSLRSYELRSMPKTKHTMLSAGCSGAWYFDWIHSNYGSVEKHIGVESYCPKPDGLSKEIEWVTANVQNMHPVNDNSVELIFSGQNVEHLWPQELYGFLCESNRILADGGILVLASPNREITKILNWSHPEHTIEFTIREIVELLEISGFEVITKKGIWLCRDPLNNRILPLNPKNSDNEWPVFRRLIEQHERPEHSFCWWVEARKKGNVKPERLSHRINEIFSMVFSERVNRLQTITGEISEYGGQRVVKNQAGNCGVLIYGPYMPLLPGKYRVEFTLRILEKNPKRGQIAIAQVFSGYYSPEGKIFTEKVINLEDFSYNNSTKVVLGWDLKEVTFGLQYRIVITAPVKIEADFCVNLVAESNAGDFNIF